MTTGRINQVATSAPRPPRGAGRAQTSLSQGSRATSRAFRGDGRELPDPGRTRARGLEAHAQPAAFPRSATGAKPQRRGFAPLRGRGDLIPSTPSFVRGPTPLCGGGLLRTVGLVESLDPSDKPLRIASPHGSLCRKPQRVSRPGDH